MSKVGRRCRESCEGIASDSERDKDVVLAVCSLEQRCSDLEETDGQVAPVVSPMRDHAQDEASRRDWQPSDVVILQGKRRS